MSADGLALGALLAVFARSSWGSRKHVLKLSVGVMVASILLIAVSFFMTRNPALCLRDTVVNYVALAIIAGFLWLGTGERRKWVNIRILSFYGFISYGLYLIHYLIIMLYRACTKTFLPELFDGKSFGLACVRFAICLALGTGLAYLSRVTYEEYFLRWKDKSARETASVSARAA
jgi:peptidoglycan/LPS O-acetylase OafA/YrhL